MKKVVVFGLLLVILALPVAASPTHVSFAHAFSTDSTIHYLLNFQHPNEDDFEVTVGVFGLTYPIVRDVDADNGKADLHLAQNLPPDAAPGKYWVRFKIEGDDDEDARVVFRPLTIR